MCHDLEANICQKPHTKKWLRKRGGSKVAFWGTKKKTLGIYTINLTEEYTHARKWGVRMKEAKIVVEEDIDGVVNKGHQKLL